MMVKPVQRFPQFILFLQVRGGPLHTTGARARVWGLLHTAGASAPLSRHFCTRLRFNLEIVYTPTEQYVFGLPMQATIENSFFCIFNVLLSLMP
jgi:hypothetical protein